MNRFEQKSFTFEGRNAVVFFPSCPSNGKLMLKTEYLTAFPFFEIEMLQRGYTLAFMSHPTRWAPDSETKVLADFVEFVAAELGMEPKVIVIGMSCGGLQAVRLAELYPHLISVLYIDAPVLNILSLAGLGECCDSAVPIFWRELVATYGFSKSTVINFRGSPIDKMEPLIENNIPVIMLYGNADRVVIYEENGKVLEDYYKAHGGDIKVISKSMTGHHPHGLTDPTPIIEFVESRL
jgi:alpha-beta hydrolase superfamily lysophospholipase